MKNLILNTLIVIALLIFISDCSNLLAFVASKLISLIMILIIIKIKGVTNED